MQTILHTIPQIMNTTADMNPIRILLVEDDVELLSHLAAALQKDVRFQITGQAENYSSARCLIDRGVWDVVLLDLLLGQTSALDLVARGTQRGCVLVHTVYGNEETVIDAICAGAAGYLVKTPDLSLLADQIAGATRVDAPISASVAGYLLRRVRKTRNEKVANTWQLTEIETEVLGLLARGFSYREVGTELSISFNTVAFHTKQIYEKLRVNSRSAAVFQAMQDGIISI